MKTVILDALAENHGDLSWDWLNEYGSYRLFDFCTKDEDEIIRRILDAECIISNKTPISKKIIDACPSIKYISLLATGFDIVDVEYAREKSIPVSNVPLYGTASVAQHAVALLLELCNKSAFYSDAVHRGRWGDSSEWCHWENPIIELSGKTMGIIGYGRIGQAVGKIAKAMGMNILAFNRSHTDSGRDIARYTDLETLLKSSDVISLHCPLNEDNIGFINKDTISKMKDGVILINNSRGRLINETDLSSALMSGKISAAGLDVSWTEPIAKTNPLLSCPNCIITPHISWTSFESRSRVMAETQANIKAFISGRPQNLVN